VIISKNTDNLKRYMDWKSKINEIYDLATLHSWCNQVNELIKEFNINYKDTKIIINYLKKILQEKKLPREHYIVSLVLLFYRKYPVGDIIELSITSLYSKLNKNDILFFRDHLFSGNFPLSNDLSQDLTNRSFLSPKVAIKKAMEIDSVISKNKPLITVLYMNFILSRLDMNEENRAMVAFLLLRLDVELPGSLRDRVFEFLAAYKDIIKELLEEENGSEVNIDDICTIEREIKKVEIIEERNIKDSDVVEILSDKKSKDYNREKKVNTKNDIEDNNEKLLKNTKVIAKYKIQKEIVKRIKNKKNETTNKIKVKNLSINEENTKNIILENEPINKISKENSKSKKIVEPDNKKNIVITHLKDSKSNIFKKNISKLNKNSKIKEAKHHNLDTTIIEEEVISIKEKIESNKESWNISLKQNRQILENILAGVSSFSPGNLLSKIKTQNKTKKSELEKNIAIPSKRLRKIYAGIMIASLIPLSFFIFAKYNKGDISSLPSESAQNGGTVRSVKGNEVLGTENKIGTSEVQDTNITNVNEVPGKKISESDNSGIPKDFPIKITIKENKINWTVVKGESITGFFFALQEFRTDLIDTELENISKLNWDDFFNRFKKNNPVRTSYHIILPGEMFVITLE